MKGYFVISDISGYTEFLTESELSHANEIIQGMMHSIISKVSSPLKISNFQGDAILMYAPEEEVLVGQSIIHQIEGIYFSFQKHLQTMNLNTTCQCKACVNVVNLDLKFFVHYGEFELQKIGDREELIGSDVILIHRLMKNDVVEKTGIHAYALFTEKATEQLGLEGYCNSSTGYCETLIDYSQSVSNVGDININIFSLRTAWEKFLKSEQDQIIIDPNESYVKVEFDLPAPPSVVWDYITKAELKEQWLQMDKATHFPVSNKKHQKESKEVYGKGSEYHCAHETGDLHYKVVDWRPFRYLTIDGTNPLFSFRQMYILEPTEFGCKYTVLLVPRSSGKIRGYLNKRKASKAKDKFQTFYSECHGLLADFILEHQEKLKSSVA